MNYAQLCILQSKHPYFPGSLSCVKKCLRNGADTNIKTNKTALDYAKAKGKMILRLYALKMLNICFVFLEYSIIAEEITKAMSQQDRNISMWVKIKFLIRYWIRKNISKLLDINFWCFNFNTFFRGCQLDEVTMKKIKENGNFKSYLNISIWVLTSIKLIFSH